jgi:CheY-like chemotaxis protein
LMDIQMPVMNGNEALYEIRRKEQKKRVHVPVIAQTAYSMRGVMEGFLRLRRQSMALHMSVDLIQYICILSHETSCVLPS